MFLYIVHRTAPVHMDAGLVPEPGEGRFEAFHVGQRIDFLCGEIHQSFMGNIDIMHSVQIVIRKLLSLLIGKGYAGGFAVRVVFNIAQIAFIADSHAECCFHRITPFGRIMRK